MKFLKTPRGADAVLMGPEPVLPAHFRCAGWLVGVHCVHYTKKAVCLREANSREIRKSTSGLSDFKFLPIDCAITGPLSQLKAL